MTVLQSKIPKRAITAALTGSVDPEERAHFTATLIKAGVERTVRDYTEIRPSRIVKAAVDLAYHAPESMSDASLIDFKACGIRWVGDKNPVPENMDIRVDSRDPNSHKLSISFTVADVLKGIPEYAQVDANNPKEPPPITLMSIARDAQIRMEVVRAIQPAVILKATALLQSSNGLGFNFTAWAHAIAQSVFSRNNLWLHTSLQPRIMQTLSGRSVSVDASYRIICELHSATGSHTSRGVHIEYNGGLFRVQASVNAIQRGRIQAPERSGTRRVLDRSLNALVLTAASPRVRKEIAQRQVVEKERIDTPALSEVLKDPGVLAESRLTDHMQIDHNTEMLSLSSEPAPGTLKAALNRLVVANVDSARDSIQAASDFWKENPGLLRPTITEIVAETLAAFGQKPKKADAEILLEMTFPRLEELAKKRQASYPDTFGVTESVAALAKMAQKDIRGRIR